jgi:hypothetical protein
VEEDCVERGYLLIPVWLEQMVSGDYEAGHETAAEAAAIGERFGDADLVWLARDEQGRALVNQGRVKEGVGFVNSVGPDLRANRASQSGPSDTPMVSAGVAGIGPPRSGRAAESAFDGDQTTGALMSPIGDAAATRSPARTEWKVAPAVRQQDSPPNDHDRVYEPYARRCSRGEARM